MKLVLTSERKPLKRNAMAPRKSLQKIPRTAWFTDARFGMKATPEGFVTLQLPVVQPDTLIPVIEIILK